MAGKVIITPPALLSFPVLVEAKLGPNSKPGDVPQFSAQLVWLKGANVTEIQAAIIAAAADKWGQEKAIKGLKTGALTSALRKDAEAKGLPEGALFMNVRTKIQPKFVYNYADPTTGKAAKVNPEDIKRVFYPGALVRASIVPFAYDRPEKKGVSFALNNMQLIDGTLPRLDGRKEADEEFQFDPAASAPDLSDLEG